MDKEKFQLIQRIILGAGILSVVLVTISVIYGLGFLSTNLLHSLSTDNNIGRSVTNFNLKGYNDLGLK